MRYTEKIKEQVNGFVSNRSLSLLFVFVIVIILLGGTYSLLIWESDESSRTAVSFTATGTLSCSADGGGDITVGSTSLIPASCTNKEHVIRRVITTNVNNLGSSATSLSMWLNVNTLGSYLADNSDFKYTLSTSDSCISDIIVSGDFGDVTVGSTLSLVDEEEYSASKETGTYYLYMWLDKSETTIPPDNLEARTMNLSLGGTCAEVDTIVEPAAPVLDTAGMIPVTIDNSGNVKTISATDENWYSYEDKKWANAILVTESSREDYLNTSGVLVNRNDILGYYVWIPKYSYKMNGKEEEIFISFDYNKDGYISHPAFKFGDDYIDGFWAGKFQSSIVGDNWDEELGLRVVDNVLFSNYNPILSEIGLFFEYGLNFSNGVFDDSNGTITFSGSSVYGLSKYTDSHMMKNSEWGAVLYLSHSQYGTCTNGICEEVEKNEFVDYGSAFSEYDILYVYKTGAGAEGNYYGNGISSYPQSSNQNITGIFDMNGGAIEHFMGKYGDSVDWSMYSKLPPSKYFDLYTTRDLSTCTTNECVGHGLSETYNWYNTNSGLNQDYNWICRDYFHYDWCEGNENSGYTFRSVLIPSSN